MGNNVNKQVWEDHRNKTTSIGGRWPNGRIYYINTISDGALDDLYLKVIKAIEVWNRYNSPHC